MIAGILIFMAGGFCGAMVMAFCAAASRGDDKAAELAAKATNAHPEQIQE